MIIEPGSRLGPYEISEPLGQGGMGQVYRARDTRLGRGVAIKVIHSEVATDAERFARFQREARLSSSLNHPNIVTIYDFANADGTAFIAMELVAGQSIRGLLRGSPLSLREALPIATQIAAGLAAAHRAGIVHRDLKPENVMITPQGAVKILDFGLAKTASAQSDPDAATEQHLTIGHRVMGTTAYMSPEQARGAEIDFRSDQFSFGVMLYEMLTGRHPFARPTVMETLVAINRDDPQPLAEVQPDLPETLIWIVDRCLEKDPARRYGSTDDLALDLARVRERSGSVRAVQSRMARSVAWPVAIGALALAALLGSLLVARMRSGPGALPPSYVALDIPGLIVGRSPINNPVAISPDGRRILIAANVPNDEPRIFVRDLSGTSTVPIAGTELGYAPTWSPDGKQIAFFANGKLKTVAIAGGAAQTLCDAFSEGAIAWSDSGTLVFGQINSPDGPGLFKIDSHGGAPVRLTRPDRQRGEFVHLWPDFLPDGKRFFFTVFSSSIQATSSTIDLMVGSIDGGAPKRIGPLSSRVHYRDGLLYFVRDSTLLSQPFDIEALRLTGDPTVIADGVEYVRDSATGSFSVARNGTIAYRSARTDSRLIVLDRAGQQLMDLGRAIFNSGRIAPDGSRVAMSVVDPKLGLADLWMYDLSGRAPSRITFETFDEGAPVWTHDAHALYYRIDIQGPPDIFRFDLDTNRREPVLMAPGRQEPLDVSPDGSMLLYQDFARSRGFDLRLLPTTAGGKPQPFIATPFDERDGRFSPGGRWVSFTSEVSGRPEVYVAHFPIRGTPIRASREGGVLARWRADGRELTFLAPSGDLMAVSVIEKGDAIDFGAPRFLFRTSEGISSYEVTSDGRFVVATDEINPPPPIRLVLH